SEINGLGARDCGTRCSCNTGRDARYANQILPAAYQATSKTGPPTSLKTGPPCLQRSVCVPLQRRLVQVGPQAAPALRSACRLKALRCAREQPVDYLDKPVSWRGLRLCGQRDQARAALLAQPVTV